VHLLRSTAYFDGHGIGDSVIVLLAWLAFGTVLSLIGHHRSRRDIPTAPILETVPSRSDSLRSALT